ncbi:MAG: hypothetical protein JKY89_06975, partial [Immundisolibacteraceae bacterium]|nr:hypothetical protein [Immundisolibacteraceae bacterium]
VGDYYKLVLPSLSWVAMAGQTGACARPDMICLIARRGGEILTVKISPRRGKEGETVILFSLSPE